LTGGPDVARCAAGCGWSGDRTAAGCGQCGGGVRAAYGPAAGAAILSTAVALWADTAAGLGDG